MSEAADIDQLVDDYDTDMLWEIYDTWGISLTGMNLAMRTTNYDILVMSMTPVDGNAVDVVYRAHGGERRVSDHRGRPKPAKKKPIQEEPDMTADRPRDHIYRSFGFTIESVRDGAGKFHSVARFTCATEGCDNIIDRTLKSGEMVPEMLVKWARRQGWDVVTGGTLGKATCPDCLHNKAFEYINPEEAEPMAKPVTDVPALPSPVTPEVIERIETLGAPLVPIRRASTEQRIEIRRLLEKNFDEELGYYVGGYSDQRIAEEVNVPRIVVEQQRETNYGPIKLTQAQVDARARMDELARRIDEVEEYGRTLVAQVTADVAALRAELNTLRKDLAA